MTDLAMEFFKKIPGPVEKAAGQGEGEGAATELAPPPSEGDMFKLILKDRFDPLLKGAARNDDPAIYVEYVVGQLSQFSPATDPDKLLNDWIINPPDPVTQLMQVIPEIGPVRPWFESLITYIKNWIKEENAGPESGKA
jgi:hypothetical protein